MLIRCADEFPESGDVVLLAEISSGTVTDRREYSHARVPVPAMASAYTINRTYPFTQNETLFETLNLGANYGFVYVTVSTESSGYPNKCMIELINGGTSTGTMQIGNTTWDFIKIKKDDTVYTITGWEQYGSNNRHIEFIFLGGVSNGNSN